MSDNVKFSFMILLGVVGIYVGLTMSGTSLSGGTALASVSSSFSGDASLLASAASVLGGASSDAAGEFLISFDDFKNVHTVSLGPGTGSLRMYDVDRDVGVSPETIYIATNQGLYASYDTGLTWKPITSLDGRLTTRSVVLQVIPVGSHAFAFSVFQNGTGYIYYTPDSFFTIEEWAHFDGEGAYDMALYGQTLYLGMSNGQLVAYHIAHDTFQVVHTFSSPIARLYGTQTGLAYVYLKSGALLRSSGDGSHYIDVRVSSGLFSSGAVDQIAFGGQGVLYVLTSDGVSRSTDGGATFSLLTNMPLLTKHINAIGASGNTVYIFSDGRLYMSVNGGVSWQLKDTIPTSATVSHMYFLGGGRVILSE